MSCKTDCCVFESLIPNPLKLNCNSSSGVVLGFVKSRCNGEYTDFTYKSNDSWLSVDGLKHDGLPSSYDAAPYISYSKNPSSSPRTATITLTQSYSGKTIQASVEQAGCEATNCISGNIYITRSPSGGSSNIVYDLKSSSPTTGTITVAAFSSSERAREFQDTLSAGSSWYRNVSGSNYTGVDTIKIKAGSTTINWPDTSDSYYDCGQITIKYV